MEREWFEHWFDTPYYHILYKDRDHTEARQFIDNLLAYLQPSKHSQILDLACGKGRFSVFLAEKGFEVTGVDLSVESIEHAKQYENEHLSFFTHDMRLPFRTNAFDYIFNFFTSFGYFEDNRSHRQTLQSVVKGLNKDGLFVLDFLNVVTTAKKLQKRQQKTVGGIKFLIRRKIEAGYIIKTIRFKDDDQPFRFQEKVRAFRLQDFQDLFDRCGLEITQLFGNYQLEPFEPETSDRLIILGRKK
ncbi:MAG: class I SAM-dependent methyltransferase [Bacteroidota bacterium]